MPNWYRIQASKKGAPAKVSIHDEIGLWGVSAKDFIGEIATLGDIDLTIHSPGGDVVDGMAIYNAILAHPGKVRVTVNTMAASMASLIALAGDEVTIADNGFFMVHNPWGMVIGDADDLDKAATEMRKWEDVLANHYVQRTGLDESEIREMMRAETWLHGQEAVDKGFALATFKPTKAAASWSSDLWNKFTNRPQAVILTAPAAEVQEPTKEPSMKVLMKALGLSDDSTEAAAVEAVNKLKAEMQAAIVSASEANEAKAQAEGELAAIRAQMEADEKARIEAAATELAETAVKSGRIDAAVKSNFIKLAKLDLDSAKAIVAGIDIPAQAAQPEQPVAVVSIDQLRAQLGTASPERKYEIAQQIKKIREGN